MKQTEEENELDNNINLVEREQVDKNMELEQIEKELRLRNERKRE